MVPEQIFTPLPVEETTGEKMDAPEGITACGEPLPQQGKA